MTQIKKTLSFFLLAGSFALLIGGTVFMFVGEARANPEAFTRKTPGVATTSPTFMTPGTATTTYTLDTGSSGNLLAPSRIATLLVQQTASSTGTELKWRYEASQDTTCGSNPTAADWYAYDVPADQNVTGTTTPVGVAALPVDYGWRYASTTPGGAAVTTSTNLGKKRIEVPVTTRCVRAIFFLPIGSTNGAVWAEWVYKKEAP